MDNRTIEDRIAYISQWLFDLGHDRPDNWVKTDIADSEIADDMRREGLIEVDQNSECQRLSAEGLREFLRTTQMDIGYVPDPLAADPDSIDFDYFKITGQLGYRLKEMQRKQIKANTKVVSLSAERFMRDAKEAVDKAGR